MDRDQIIEQPEALRLADQLDDPVNAKLYLAPYISAELRRLHAEVERKSDAIQRIWKERDELRVEVARLNEALQWEQNRRELIGTHGWGCWSWGPAHYMCAVTKIKELEDDGK